MLSLGASEPFQSVCPTANSTDSFVPTHTSKASKDSPVGLADFGSVSVTYLQFSVGSRIIVCMSCWSHGLTLQNGELHKAEDVSSLFLGLMLTVERDHRAAVFTGCWLTTDRTPQIFKGLMWKGGKKVFAWLTQTVLVLVYVVNCYLHPPGKGNCMLLSSLASAFDRDIESGDLYTFSQWLSKLAWSGSTQGAFFNVLKYKLKAYLLSKHDMPRSREHLLLCPVSSALAECALKWRDDAWQLFFCLFCIIWHDMNLFYPSC